jgi:hypothetical protein
MSFKDQVEKDNRAVINSDEFGVEILWEGEPVLADISDQETESTDHYGINEKIKTVVLNSSDVTAPVPEQYIYIDGEKLRVKSVDVDFGLLEVVFYRNES